MTHLALCLLLLIVSATPLLAISVTWTGADASTTWEVAANWQPAIVPGPVDKVVIPSSTPSVILSVSTAISSLDLQGGNLTLAADAVLLADSISVQGALSLANGAILSARGVIILTSVNITMKSASLSATQSINATNVSIVSGTSSVITSPTMYLADTRLIVRPDDPLLCMIAPATLSILGDVIDSEVSSSYLLTYVTSKNPPIYGKLRITGTFYSLSFLVFIAYNGSYDPEGLHYFDATAVDPSTQFLVQPVSLQNNASRCKNYSVRNMVGEEGSIDACYAGGSLIVLGSQSCPVQTLCTPGYGGSQCQTPICSSGCSGQGQCISNLPNQPFCSCDNNWSDATCSTPLCLNGCKGNHGICLPTTPKPMCYCARGWSGADCSVPVCYGCLANQYCEALANPPECRCSTGWSGAQCDIPVNELCPRNCSAAGACNDTTGECTCLLNQGGLDCSIPLCIANCSLRGVCEANHTCSCDFGYSGDTCNQGSCPGCTNGVCDGALIDPQCVCLPDWTGNACTEYVGEAKRSRGGHSLTTGQKVAIGVGSAAAIVIALVVVGVILYNKGALRGLFTSREASLGLVR